MEETDALGGTVPDAGSPSITDLISITDDVEMLGCGDSISSTDSESSMAGLNSCGESCGSVRQSTRTKYNLRKSSVVNRIVTEIKRTSPREKKPKAKPPPLSKYRRKAANTRERSRMEEINVAFAELRNAIPQMDDSASNAKMTKITTLRLAMKYIAALRQTLGHDDDLGSDASSVRTSCTSGDEACLSPSDTDLTTSDSGTEDPAIVRDEPIFLP